MGNSINYAEPKLVTCVRLRLLTYKLRYSCRRKMRKPDPVDTATRRKLRRGLRLPLDDDESDRAQAEEALTGSYMVLSVLLTRMEVHPWQTPTGSHSGRSKTLRLRIHRSIPAFSGSTVALSFSAKNGVMTSLRGVRIQ
jgi:hypothetical protein